MSIKDKTKSAINITKSQISKTFDYAKLGGGKLKQKIDFKIQEKAVLNLKVRLAMNHQSFDDFSDEEIEIMLSDARASVIDSLKNKTLIAALAVLGLDFLV
ncbi:hypothetical protein CIG2463D_0224 [Campylobacter iguaniorum]|uniref:Uncharacterized protein n=1 Tax=Campylobacter iguaniorum TaxID=1244531 RepID=A0A076F732_9BACT|nr:hypothetical protein [Campylobacter iguaniorum]AII14090.1 hypothetical protein CIG1485E_0219 [Campylobacter iguaniorum]ALV23829.1 hypothetical protein CIG2463D_0224 [Campylobacter iguaniorum]